MTWRAHWHNPGEWWPSWADHATEDEAHLFALRKSAAIGDEVAVIEINGGTTE